CRRQCGSGKAHHSLGKVGFRVLELTSPLPSPTDLEEGMRIAMVGGLDRNESLLSRLAGEAGHEMRFHHGRRAARGGGTLRALVSASDVLVLTPDVNSHGAVQLGKRLARELGSPWVVLRTCGVARFRTLLGELRGHPVA